MIAVLTALAALSIPPQAGDVPAGGDRPARTAQDVLDKFPGPQDGFMLRLQSLCGGERYPGRVTSDDPQDAEMRGERLVMGPADCTLAADGTLSHVAIPFAVGDDASRTWVIDRTEAGLRLRHRHTHEDGTTDALTMYGGTTTDEGGFTRQAFPADAESRALFAEQGIPASSANVWAVEVVPGDAFAYELERPGRAFRAEFDLSRPLTGGAY